MKAKTVGPPGRPYLNIGPIAADAPLASLGFFAFAGR